MKTFEVTLFYKHSIIDVISLMGKDAKEVRLKAYGKTSWKEKLSKSRNYWIGLKRTK